MAQVDVAGFASDLESLAAMLESRDMPGLLSKRLEVPAGVVGLVRSAEGGESVLTAGQEATGSFRATLVKPGERALSFQLEGLKNKNGHATSAGVEVSVVLPERLIDLKTFEGELFSGAKNGSRLLNIADLKSYLLPHVRSGMRAFVAGRSAEDLLVQDPRQALEDALREALKGATFAAGLELASVNHPSFYCEAFEHLRRERAHAAVEQEAIEREERMLSLRARLERNERLKRHEVEAFAKALEYEGVKKELSLKQDLVRRRRDEKLEEFERVQEKVGNDDLKALVLLLEDDQMKAKLLEQLIEREMSEDQIRAKRLTDLERRLEQKFETFQRDMDAVAGKRRERLAKGGRKTRRVIVVMGKQALAYDPTTNVRPESPKETYDFSTGPLGYIRSESHSHASGAPHVLLGAQQGVYAVPVGGRARDARTYMYPSPPRGQGGINAVCSFDGWLYATHSELGLHRWDLDRIVRPESMFAHITDSNESTRGVTVSPDGKLYFASGDAIYRADLVQADPSLVGFRGAGDAITAFVTSDDELFAGTRAGRVLRWSFSDPGSP
ncbi:MAG: hypothetical protein ACYS22_05725, partial [Planctomycetota bacterium]